jgi:LacI family transcriptional regulator
MTVSNVINRRDHKVSPAMRKRVREKIDELGFVSDASARVLKTRRSNIIALVYPSDPALLSNQHDAVLLGAVEQHVSEGDRHLMIWAARNVVATAGNLRRWRIDGAICYGTYNTQVDDLVEKSDVPIVFVDNYSESPLVKRVRVDDYRGGELAAERLLEAGHRRLGFVGPPIDEVGVVSERYRGFQAAIAASRKRVDQVRVECAPRFEDAAESVRLLTTRADPPTGVFAAADIIALGLLNGFLSNGIGVPDQVSLIGFDDIPEASRGVPSRGVPALTTIHQNVAEKARAAVEMLDDLIEHDGHVPNRPPLPVKLVERDSVGLPPP